MWVQNKVSAVWNEELKVNNRFTNGYLPGTVSVCVDKMKKKKGFWLKILSCYSQQLKEISWKLRTNIKTNHTNLQSSLPRQRRGNPLPPSYHPHPAFVLVRTRAHMEPLLHQSHPWRQDINFRKSPKITMHECKKGWSGVINAASYANFINAELQSHYANEGFVKPLDKYSRLQPSSSQDRWQVCSLSLDQRDAWV